LAFAAESGAQEVYLDFSLLFHRTNIYNISPSPYYHHHHIITIFTTISTPSAPIIVTTSTRSHHQYHIITMHISTAKKKKQKKTNNGNFEGIFVTIQNSQVKLLTQH